MANPLNNKTSYKVETQALPYPPYKRVDKSHYNIVLATLIPAAIVLRFVFMICNAVKVIVEERLTGIYLKKIKLENFIQNLFYYFIYFRNEGLLNILISVSSQIDMLFFLINRDILR